MAIEVGEGVWFAKGWRSTLLVCLSSFLLSFQSGDGSEFVHIGNDCGEDYGIVLSGKPEGLGSLKSFVKLDGVKYREAREESMLAKWVEEYKPLHWEICMNNLVEVYREYCMEAFNDEIWTLGSEEYVSGSIDPFSLLIIEGSRIGRDARNGRRGKVLEYRHPVSLPPPGVEAEMETTAAARNPVLLMSNSEESSYLQQSKVLEKEAAEKKKLLRKYTTDLERKGRAPYGAVFRAHKYDWDYMERTDFDEIWTSVVLKLFLPAFVKFLNNFPEKALLLASWADTEKGREWIELVVKGGKEEELVRKAKGEKLDEAFSVAGGTVKERKEDLLGVEVELLRNRVTKDVGDFDIEKVVRGKEWPRFRLGLPNGKFGGAIDLNEKGSVEEAIVAALETWICQYLPWVAWYKWILNMKQGWWWHRWMVKENDILGMKWLDFLSKTEAGTAFLYNRVLENILSSPSSYTNTQAYKDLTPHRQALFTHASSSHL